MDIEKIKAVVVGHAIGDALGVPVEFASREELNETPVTDMEGYGTYPMPKGAWSDDTSMSLCALDALHKYGLDYDRIMCNFAKWYYNDEFTPTGEMFDVGNTCSTAIENYVVYKKHYTRCGLKDEKSNGNGSLMRIHPFVLYLADKDIPLRAKLDVVHMASALTHAHMRSKIGCGIYAFILWKILKNPKQVSIIYALKEAEEYYKNESEAVHYRRIFDFIDPDTFYRLPRYKIKSGGYVVDTLEAALWCVLTTSSYKQCVLKAVNLGDDTDTVTAIAGGLAGALYGYDSIPDEWKDALIKREYIEELASRL